MNNLKVLIYTRNEELKISDCIKSAKLLSKNIAIIDMESTDNTLVIAKKNHVEVMSFPYSFYVEPAREFGIKKSKSDWVFIIDADERITEALAKEIKQQLEINNRKISNKYSYFKIPRKNIFGGKKWLKHGGWWPDYQIRLINTRAFITWPKQIHSTPQIKGNGGYLQNPLFHYFHGNIQEMVKKTTVFENIESDLLYKANKSVSIMTLFRKFFGELFRRLIKEKGFLDGTIGVIECIYQAYSKTITYIYLYEKKTCAL